MPHLRPHAKFRRCEHFVVPSYVQSPVRLDLPPAYDGEHVRGQAFHPPPPLSFPIQVSQLRDFVEQPCLDAPRIARQPRPQAVSFVIVDEYFFFGNPQTDGLQFVGDATLSRGLSCGGDIMDSQPQTQVGFSPFGRNLLRNASRIGSMSVRIASAAGPWT